MAIERLLAALPAVIGFVVASALYLLLPPLHAVFAVAAITAGVVCGYILSLDARRPHR